MVLTYVNSYETVERFTPYAIAKGLGLSAGSVTAACKALVQGDQVRLFGTSPYMIGRKE
jgi:hypothetical protein